MKSPVSTNICYAFLALSITVLPAACAQPDSGPTGTPAPKEEEPPVPEWRWSQLTNSENHWLRFLHLNPHTSMLYVMTLTAYGEKSPVMGILMRQIMTPSNREIFPLRFFTAERGSNRFDPSAKLCGEEICAQYKHFINDVVFDNQGKVYLLDSTRDTAASSDPVKIVAFKKNYRHTGAHPREILAGGGIGGFGHADGTGANAWFSEGVRNMALSTDEKYIYLADWRNNSVRAVEIQSKKVTTLKPTDKEGKAVGLSYPTGIAVGKGNTVYTIRNSGEWGETGEIAALTVPLPLPADNVVRARVLKLIDEKTNKAYQLRDNPVWYIAVDDNGVLYSHIQRASKRYIVRIRLKDANAEDLVGVVSEIAVMRGVVEHDSKGIRGLEVSGDGNTIYYASQKEVYAYTYE